MRKILGKISALPSFGIGLASVKGQRASYLDGRVQRKVAFYGVKVAGIDVAEPQSYRFAVGPTTSLRAPRHSTSRRHKQLVAGGYLSNVFPAANGAKSVQQTATYFLAVIRTDAGQQRVRGVVLDHQATTLM